MLGVAPAVIKQKLTDVPGARQATIVKEETQAVWARVYPKAGEQNGRLARSVAEVTLREGWKIEELHTEEGRLDEVFRSITSRDTGTKVETPVS